MEDKDNSLNIQFSDNGNPSSIEYGGENFDTIEELPKEIEQLARTLTGFHTQLKPVFDSLKPVLNQVEDVAEVALNIQKSRESIRKGIVSFPSPEDYSPAKVEIEERAVEKSVSDLERINRDYTEFPDSLPERMKYQERLQAGLDAFQNGDNIKAIFLFMSLQDGLMHFICEAKRIEYNNQNENIYTFKQKKKNLASHLAEWINLEDSDTAKEKIGNFLDHRNSIMHGDPEVHLDREIAEASLIFLSTTFSVALTLLEDEDFS